MCIPRLAVAFWNVCSCIKVSLSCCKFRLALLRNLTPNTDHLWLPIHWSPLLAFRTCFSVILCSFLLQVVTSYSWRSYIKLVWHPRVPFHHGHFSIINYFVWEYFKFLASLASFFKHLLNYNQLVLLQFFLSFPILTYRIDASIASPSPLKALKSMTLSKSILLWSEV